MTLAALLDAVRTILSAARIANAAFESRRLVLGYLDMPAKAAITDGGREIGGRDAESILRLARERAAGAPLHRLLGWREFHGLRLALSSETLEPRDDTEAVVTLCLPFLRDVAARHSPSILDLGTGTGAIALALLSEVESATAVGIDLSQDALDTAQRNASENGLSSRFVTRRSDWFDAVDGRFDLIVSNPPYIESARIAMLDRSVRDHDPRLALDGGADGLDAYRLVAANARARLAAGGHVAVEIGFGQRADVTGIFAHNEFQPVQTERDLNGVERALLFSLG